MERGFVMEHFEERLREMGVEELRGVIRDARALLNEREREQRERAGARSVSSPWVKAEPGWSTSSSTAATAGTASSEATTTVLTGISTDIRTER